MNRDWASDGSRLLAVLATALLSLLVVATGLTAPLPECRVPGKAGLIYSGPKVHSIVHVR